MVRRLTGFLLTMLVGMAGLPNMASATRPSFDCTKARAPLAVAICSNDALSTLDLSFADAYQALRQAVGPQGKAEVFQEAINFQTTVNTVCNLPQDLAGFDPSRYTDCIQKLYLQQRAAWAGRLSGSALEETSLAPEQLLAAQAQLESQGYLPEGSQIDGVFGPSTRAAITEFQQAKNLPISAFLDDATFDALMSGATSPAAAPTGNAAAAVAAPAPPATGGLSDATQLAIAKAQAAEAQADAAKAQAEAVKAEADEATQIAITQRQLAAAQAVAAAQAAAKQKAADEAKALQDAQGASP
jgi:hypothetical protein